MPPRERAEPPDLRQGQGRRRGIEAGRDRPADRGREPRQQRAAQRRRPGVPGSGHRLTLAAMLPEPGRQLRQVAWTRRELLRHRQRPQQRRDPRARVHRTPPRRPSGRLAVQRPRPRGGKQAQRGDDRDRADVRLHEEGRDRGQRRHQASRAFRDRHSEPEKEQERQDDEVRVPEAGEERRRADHPEGRRQAETREDHRRETVRRQPDPSGERADVDQTGAEAQRGRMVARCRVERGQELEHHGPRVMPIELRVGPQQPGLARRVEHVQLGDREVAGGERLREAPQRHGRNERRRARQADPRGRTPRPDAFAPCREPEEPEAGEAQDDRPERILQGDTPGPEAHDAAPGEPGEDQRDDRRGEGGQQERDQRPSCPLRVATRTDGHVVDGG